MRPHVMNMRHGPAEVTSQEQGAKTHFRLRNGARHSGVKDKALVPVADLLIECLGRS